MAGKTSICLYNYRQNKVKEPGIFQNVTFVRQIRGKSKTTKLEKKKNRNS